MWPFSWSFSWSLDPICHLTRFTRCKCQSVSWHSCDILLCGCVWKTRAWERHKILPMFELVFFFFFFRFSCFAAPVYITIFRFCATLEVVETQLQSDLTVCFHSHLRHSPLHLQSWRAGGPRGPRCTRWLSTPGDSACRSSLTAASRLWVTWWRPSPSEPRPVSLEKGKRNITQHQKSDRRLAASLVPNPLQSWWAPCWPPPPRRRASTSSLMVCGWRSTAAWAPWTPWRRAPAARNATSGTRREEKLWLCVLPPTAWAELLTVASAARATRWRWPRACRARYRTKAPSTSLLLISSPASSTAARTSEQRVFLSFGRSLFLCVCVRTRARTLELYVYVDIYVSDAVHVEVLQFQPHWWPTF